jgi:peptidoglycan/LPS O-acetylase OafA/YrhL
MAAIASLSICALVSQNTFGFDAVFLCLTGFFIGCITAFFSANRKKNLPTVMPLLVLCLLLLFLQYKTDQRADIIIFPLTALLILSIANSDDGFLKTILRSRPLVWLGTISYSVYMTHTAVLWIFIQVYRVILKRPETVVGGKSVPQLGFLEATLTYIVVIALILIFSAITYRLIEAPLRSKSRKFAMQKFR